jgi:hypothetical protein
MTALRWLPAVFFALLFGGMAFIWIVVLRRRPDLMSVERTIIAGRASFFVIGAFLAVSAFALESFWPLVLLAVVGVLRFALERALRRRLRLSRDPDLPR